MRILVGVLLLQCVLFVYGVWWYFSDDYDYTRLNDANFDAEALHGGRYAFVKFHAQWCAPCKKLVPAWKLLAKAFENSSNVIIAEVDCSESRSLCARVGIQDHPTLRYWGPSTIQLESGDEYHLPPARQSGYRNLKRTSEALISHARRELDKPMCLPGSLDLCGDETSKALAVSAGVLQSEGNILSKLDEIDKELQTAEAMRDAAVHTADAALEKVRIRIAPQKRMLKTLIRNTQRSHGKGMTSNTEL